MKAEISFDDLLFFFEQQTLVMMLPKLALLRELRKNFLPL